MLCIGSKCGTSQCTNTIHKSSRIPKLHLYRCYIQIRDPKAKKSSSVQSNITSRLLAQAFSTYLHSGMACKILSKARAQDRCQSSTRGKRRKKANSVPTTIARQSATLFEGLGNSCYNLRFGFRFLGRFHVVIRSRKTRDPKKSVVFPPSGACFCSRGGGGRPILSKSYLPTYLLEGLKTGSVPRETRCLKEGSGGVGGGWW